MLWALWQRHCNSNLAEAHPACVMENVLDRSADTMSIGANSTSHTLFGLFIIKAIYICGVYSQLNYFEELQFLSYIFPTLLRTSFFPSRTQHFMSLSSFPCLSHGSMCNFFFTYSFSMCYLTLFDLCVILTQFFFDLCLSLACVLLISACILPILYADVRK